MRIIDVANLTRKGNNIVQANEGFVVGSMGQTGKGKSGVKNGGRNGLVSGPKGKQFKNNRPTRGLIFGPIQK